MDFAKIVVIIIVVALALVLMAAVVVGHEWVQPAKDAALYMNQPAVDLGGSADASTTPWAVAVGVLGVGLGGMPRAGGLSLFTSVATFMLLMLVVWFIFRLALRVLKG